MTFSAGFIEPVCEAEAFGENARRNKHNAARQIHLSPVGGTLKPAAVQEEDELFNR